MLNLGNKFIFNMENTNTVVAPEAQPGVVKPQDVPVNNTGNAQTQAQTTEPAKTEPAKTTDPVQSQSTEQTASTEAPFTLSAEVYKDVPTSYKEGSHQFFADKLGFQIAEDTLEAFQNTFKDKYVTKEEAQKQATVNEETFYSRFKPEVATAFKMIAEGVPAEYAFNPTKIQDEYIAMSDSDLAKAKLAAQGYDEAGVDLEMENLSSNPAKLATFAKNIRTDLENQRKEILSTQQQIYQDQVNRRNQESALAKEVAATNFKKILATESTFLGAPLSDAIKQNIQAKYDRGLYNDILSDPRNVLLAILQKEHGEEISKALISRARSEGKAEIIQNLSNVPTKVSPGGSKVDIKPDASKSDSYFSDMPERFKK